MYARAFYLNGRGPRMRGLSSPHLHTGTNPDCEQALWLLDWDGAGGEFCFCLFFFPPLADLAETKEFRERGSYTRKSHWSIQGNKTDRNIERHTERYTYIERHRVKKNKTKQVWVTTPHSYT